MYAGRSKLALKPWRTPLKSISNASAIKLSQFLSYVSMEGLPGAVSSDIRLIHRKYNLVCPICEMAAAMAHALGAHGAW